MDQTNKRKRYELSRRVAFETPYFQVGHDRYRLPRDGGEGDYYYVDIADSTMIVPELDDGRLVFVQQHRYLMGRSSLEFPGGGIKGSLAPLDNAREELREEAGYEALEWRELGLFAPCNGLTNEMCRVFHARGLRAVEAQPEATEDMEVVLLSLEQARSAVASGALWDGQAIVCLSYYERLVSAPQR